MHMARMCGSNTTCQKMAVVDTHILFLQHTFSNGCGINLHLSYTYHCGPLLEPCGGSGSGGANIDFANSSPPILSYATTISCLH